MTNKGVIFGFIVLIGLVNTAIGLSILAFYSIIFLSNHRFQVKDNWIFILAIIKVILIILISLLLSNKNFKHLIPVLMADIVLIVLLFVSVDKKFITGFSYPVFILFFTDLFFNIHTLYFGFNPYGNQILSRPDDFIPRLGGVFEHPFYSINISLAALFLSFLLKKRLILILSIIGILINGSYRGYLSIFYILIIFILLKIKISKISIFICFFIMVLAVVLATVYVADLSEVMSGNKLRVMAWMSALTKISENPILGNHDFLIGDFENLNHDNFLDYGYAESTYLQYALDYGVITAIISFFIITRIAILKIQNFYLPHLKNNIAISSLAAFVFVDIFYGNFYGAYLSTVIYYIICLCYSEK
jgi:hypothetical protein